MWEKFGILKMQYCLGVGWLQAALHLMSLNAAFQYILKVASDSITRWWEKLVRKMFSWESHLKLFSLLPRLLHQRGIKEKNCFVKLGPCLIWFMALLKKVAMDLSLALQRRQKRSRTAVFKFFMLCQIGWHFSQCWIKNIAGYVLQSEK